MNKKLIAVAVAGVLAAPAVMADNSVTIYGVADVGLEQVEAKGATAGAASDVAGKSRVLPIAPISVSKARKNWAAA
ncbi:MAG: porin [Burkholderiales bacterium]